jgi:tripartite-type tricarboxylate transporter receptor subunit TctC
VNNIGKIALALTLACTWLAPSGAAAQDYPTRPVKIIVPTVAGGVVDVVTRLLANELTTRLGQSFFIDNRSGAGNTLGSREAARAAPDGTTLLMSSASGQVISPLIYKDAGYDPIRSFVPIALFAEGSIILVVNPKAPWQSVGQIVAEAKANPGKLNYGSAGTGTIPHLTGELFKATAGVDLVHVPYRGGSLTIADLIAGNINMTFEGSGPLLPHLREGRLRPLAVMSEARIADLPEVLTMVEAGYPNVLSTSWTGLFAPAGTPPAIVAQLNAAINAALATPELKAALGKLGNRPLGGPPEALTRKVDSDIQRWTPIVRALDLKAN